MLTAVGSKEAEMRMIGCDLHASQQSIGMLDLVTREVSGSVSTDMLECRGRVLVTPAQRAAT